MIPENHIPIVVSILALAITGVSVVWLVRRRARSLDPAIVALGLQFTLTPPSRDSIPIPLKEAYARELGIAFLPSTGTQTDWRKQLIKIPDQKRKLHLIALESELFRQCGVRFSKREVDVFVSGGNLMEILDAREKFNGRVSKQLTHGNFEEEKQPVLVSQPIPGASPAGLHYLSDNRIAGKLTGIEASLRRQQAIKMLEVQDDLREMGRDFGSLF